MDDVSVLGTGHAHKEVIWFNVAVNEGLVVYGLDTVNLARDADTMRLSEMTRQYGVRLLTICFAAMHTVLIVN
jgi:hypothetical protein